LKIKIWALVLIIVGSLVLGSAAGFGLTGGITAADHLLQSARSLHLGNTLQAPNDNGSNNNNNGNNGGGRLIPPDNNMPGWQFSMVPKLPDGLPEGFNAGVNIESAYAALTGRTAEQVQAAEREAGTDVWGLAQKEGKLDALKTKLTDDVEASLKQMVADGKITQTQSDAYLDWVKQYLEVISRQATGEMPGFGRYMPRRGWQTDPSATAAPEATPTPEPVKSQA
jgi:hypothetical protein